MLRRLSALFVLSVSLAAREARAQTPAAAQTCAPAKTALVLSGGGAKGFAHIGVMEVMDSLGLVPDLIVGTSIGSIMGALYASGYTGKQIDSITRTLPIEQMIRKYEPRISSATGILRPLIVWEKGQSGYVVQSGAVREGEVNALFSSLMLRANLIARGNFDSLPIPFRAVATDVATRGTVVLSGGDLALAVRASAAIPVVLRPVQIGKQWLVDGGIAENAPVNVARSLGAQRAWISLLPFAGPDPKTFDDPLTITSVLLNSLFEQDTIAAERRDVLINNPTTKFENLDFSRPAADSLIEIGKNAARAAFAAAPCLKSLSSTRRIIATPTMVSHLGFSGANVVDGDLVIDELGIWPGDTLHIGKLQQGIQSISQHERYRGLWLWPGGTGSDVSFHIDLEPAATSTFGFGIAFDQFMSGRIWFGGVKRTLFNGDAEGVGIVHLGTYEQDIDAFVRRRALVKHTYVPLTLEGTIRHESVRLFNGGGELPSAETQEFIGFIGLKQDAKAGKWQGEIGFDSRLWHEPGVDTRGTFGVRASVFQAETEHEMGTSLEGLVLYDYQRLQFDGARRWDMKGGFDMTARLRVGWGNRLPIQETFALGGDDGFAGFRIGELRGPQELFGSLVLRQKLNYALHIRVEAMTGEVARNEGVLKRIAGTPYGEVFGGLRAGLEAETPVGPIRVEEGISNTGQRAILIRVGRWF